MFRIFVDCGIPFVVTAATLFALHSFKSKYEKIHKYFVEIRAHRLCAELITLELNIKKTKSNFIENAVTVPKIEEIEQHLEYKKTSLQCEKLSHLLFVIREQHSPNAPIIFPNFVTRFSRIL